MGMRLSREYHVITGVSVQLLVLVRCCGANALELKSLQIVCFW